MGRDYPLDPWKAYAGWLSPAWAAPRTDFDAGEWCAQLRDAGFQNVVIHAKHHDGICFFPSRFRRNHPERDFFGQLAAEAKRRGMGVVAYYSTLFDSLTAAEQPNLVCREEDGSITEIRCFPFPVGVCCHNNPGYRTLLLGQLAELQERYDTDGFWMDGFDYTGFTSGACFCDHCRRRYSEENNAADLADAWREHRAEVKRWHTNVFQELLEQISAIAASDGRHRVVTYNNAGESLEPGFERLDAICSHNCAEAHSPVVKSTKSRLLAAQGRPFEVYSPVSDVVFSWTMRSRPMLELESSIVLAHGGTVLAGLDITPSGSIPHEQMRVLADVAPVVREKSARLRGTVPVYDVALMAPKSRWKDESGGWIATLLGHHVPYALLPLHEVPLSPYRVVVVSDGYPVTASLAEQLSAYVESGGAVVVERTSVGKEHGGSAVLGELLGLDRVSETGFETTYIGDVAEHLTDGLPDAPVRCEGEALVAAPDGARVLARFQPPIARYSRDRWLWREPHAPGPVPGEPILTVNSFGQGKAVFLGAALETPLKPQNRAMARLCANLVRSLDPEPLIWTDAPSGVEIVLGRMGGRGGPGFVIHFLNHYVAMSTLHDEGEHGIPRISDVAVRVNERRVGRVERLRRLSDGRELPVCRDGRWVEVHLEYLAVHEMVALETSV